MAEVRIGRLQLERELAEARAALSACQEELARLGGAYREVVEWWRAAEAARDELARAIERRYDGPGTADEAVAAALEAFYGKVSSEATKGDAE